MFAAVSLVYCQLYSKLYLYQGWVAFGEFVGKINSKIILFALFFGVFSPVGIFLRIIRKDLLHKKIDKNASSYFIKRTTQPGSMVNQF